MKELALSIKSAFIIGFILSIYSCDVHDNFDYDVVVYGGTPGGIMASIAAAREGASVVLLEQTKHIGGLSTSGLNRDEGEHMDRSTLGGLSDKFTAEAAIRSGTTVDTGSEPRIWQSHIAENVFLDMLGEYNISVVFEQLLDGVDKTGNTISSIQVQGGRSYKAKVYIDATYEGDLMAKAGVSYTMGREALSTYNESKAGVRYMDEKVNVPPYDDEGNFITKRHAWGIT